MIFGRRPLGWLFAALLLVGVLGSAMVLRAGTEEEQRRIEAAEADERRLLEELDALEKKIETTRSRLAEIEAEIRATRKRLQEGGKEKKVLEGRLKEVQGYLSERLRAIYRLKEGGLIQVLLEAESIPELVRLYRYLSALLAHDQALLEEFARRGRELAARLKRLEADQAGLESLQAETRAREKELLEARHQKTALLMKVHQKKELYLALVRAREESRRELIKEVTVGPPESEEAEAPAEAAPPRPLPDFASFKGRLPWPVAGRITREFGRKRGPFNTYTTRHGVSLEAEPGDTVRAVALGRVIFAGWLKGFGNVVVLDHGRRYYTLTARLSGLKARVGEWVEAGEILGQVPEGSHPSEKNIYFEIRHRSQALDPAPWFGSKSAREVKAKERGNAQ